MSRPRPAVTEQKLLRTRLFRESRQSLVLGLAIMVFDLSIHFWLLVLQEGIGVCLFFPILKLKFIFLLDFKLALLPLLDNKYRVTKGLKTIDKQAGDELCQAHIKLG